MPIIIDEGGPNDVQAIQLATRAKNWIRNHQEPERNPDSLRDGVRFVVEGYPGARPISATAVYNCFGMIFGERRTWIEPSEVQDILRDDEFRRLGDDPVAWDVGDVVLYRDNHEDLVHVGIIQHVETSLNLTVPDKVTVVSTWGQTGEFEHPLDLVHPMHGRVAEIWTQRREWTPEIEAQAGPMRRTLKSWFLKLIGR